LGGAGITEIPWVLPSSFFFPHELLKTHLTTVFPFASSPSPSSSGAGLWAVVPGCEQLLRWNNCAASDRGQSGTGREKCCV